MPDRMDKGVNVLNVVMQDGQRSQCVEHHKSFAVCYVELVSDTQLTFLLSGCPARASVSVYINTL